MVENCRFELTSGRESCRSAEEILNAINELDMVRHDFGFETDGAVIKLNNRALREQVGESARAPKWARAWKYAAEQATTRLRAITVQVGRTGVLTPVAELEPVVLRGSTISRATCTMKTKFAARTFASETWWSSKKPAR